MSTFAFATSGGAVLRPNVSSPSTCLRTSSSNYAVVPRRTVRMTAASPSPAKTAEPGALEAAWEAFAAKMKASSESPPIEEWNALLETADAPAKAVWVMNTMRDTGRMPTAGTYQRIIDVCERAGDRPAAFHMVELMFKDKILIGDVDLPDGMEAVLRTILPPEAFD